MSYDPEALQPTSLSVQAALKFLSPDALNELSVYLNRYTYRYLIVDQSYEISRPTDMHCLRQVETFSAQQLLEILYNDPKVMKFIAWIGFIRDLLHEKGFAFGSSMIGPYSLSSTVKNEQEISQFLKDNLSKEILLDTICSLTHSIFGVPTIIIYNANFDIISLYVNDIKEVCMKVRPRGSNLYSYREM